MRPSTNGVIDSSCQRCFPAFPDDAVMTDAKAKVFNPASSVKVSGIEDSAAAKYYGREELAAPMLVRMNGCMSTLGNEVSIPQFDGIDLKVRPENSNRGFMSGAMGLLIYREMIKEGKHAVRWVTPTWFQSNDERKARCRTYKHCVE